MAIICRDAGLLFIMTPRTGCTAIERLLTDGFGGERLPREPILGADGRYVVQTKHNTVSELRRHGLLTEADLGRLVVFAGVRNPYDSLVSLFVKLTETYRPLLDDPDAWVHKVPGYVDNMRYARRHGFRRWIAWHFARPAVGQMLGRRHSLYERFTERADMVIRFETLQEDFEAVLRRAGIGKRPSVPRINITRERGGAYRDYFDPVSRAITYWACRPDIERFDYAF